MMSKNDPRIFGDQLNATADMLADSFKLSKCEAISIVAQVLLDDNITSRVQLSGEERKVVEDFVLASCLDNNDYLFRDGPAQQGRNNFKDEFRKASGGAYKG
jgi:hypothetical protein